VCVEGACGVRARALSQQHEHEGSDQGHRNGEARSAVRRYGLDVLLDDESIAVLLRDTEDVLVQEAISSVGPGLAAVDADRQIDKGVGVDRVVRSTAGDGVTGAEDRSTTDRALQIVVGKQALKVIDVLVDRKRSGDRNRCQGAIVESSRDDSVAKLAEVQRAAVKVVSGHDDVDATELVRASRAEGRDSGRFYE